MIIPYDLDIFKRTDDVKMKNTMNNKTDQIGMIYVNNGIRDNK